MPPLLIPIIFAAGLAAGKISHELEDKKKKQEEERRHQARLRAEQQSKQREQIKLRKLREHQAWEETNRQRRELEEQVEKERVEREARAAEAEAERIRLEKEKHREERARKRKEREDRLRREEEEEKQRKAEIAKQQADDDAAQKERQNAAHQRAVDAQTPEHEEFQHLLHGIPPDVRPSPEDFIRVRQEHAYQPNNLNIAIVGQSGVGKSSLLNAFRAVNPTDPTYAPTGINETTATVKAYPDPRRRSVVWYDVPGTGTPNIKGWDYFVARGLYAFDALVIVFGERFTVTTTTLIKNAKECNIPVFLVRTKVDRLVEGVMTDEEVEEEEASEIVRLSTRQLVDDTLKKVGLPGRGVYLVEKDKLAELIKVTAEWAQARFDESALMKDILSIRGIQDEVEEDEDFQLL